MNKQFLSKRKKKLLLANCGATLFLHSNGQKKTPHNITATNQIPDT